MYNLVGGNLKEFKNLGMIYGFNIEKPKNMDNKTNILKINEINVKNDNIIEDAIYMKFYDFISLKNKKLTRKHDKKKLHKSSRKK